MSIIVGILKDKGPMRSSEIVGILKRKEHLSDEAARKRISRARAPVLKLKGIRELNMKLNTLEDDKIYLGFGDATPDSFATISFSLYWNEAATALGKIIMD